MRVEIHNVYNVEFQLQFAWSSVYAGNQSHVQEETFKYRLYPNRQLTRAIAGNARRVPGTLQRGAEERRDEYRTSRAKLNYYTQSEPTFLRLREIRPDIASVHSQVLQDTLRRLDKSFQSFFRRVQQGQKPGFPRFQGIHRYDSFTYPQAGFRLGAKLQLSKIGNVKIKLHRELKGEVKTLTIKRGNGHWYACFSCVVESDPLPVLDNSTGIDVGLETFATFSNGDKIPNPRWYRVESKSVFVETQRKVARRTNKKSNRRRKAVAILAQVHRDIFNNRNDFQHKESLKIIQQYQTIFVEDLNIKGLSQGICKISGRCVVGLFPGQDFPPQSQERTGRQFIQVDARGTKIQQCPCGAANRKTLSDREHVCAECGLVTSRDHASAMEILRLGLSLQAPTILETECIA